MPRSDASWGVWAIVVFIAIFVRIFVGPRWWMRLRGEIGSGVEVDIVWGFGCTVVGVMFIDTCGGRWWGIGCGVVI